MTLLEQIVRQQVDSTIVGTLSRTTEKIAEEMANEILNDPAFRARMRQIIDESFGQSLKALDANTKSRRKRSRK